MHVGAEGWLGLRAQCACRELRRGGCFPIRLRGPEYEPPAQCRPGPRGGDSENQQDVLLQTGEWLKKVGPAIYTTRGGPWQPRHGEFGFTYKDNKIYCHVYKDYRDKSKGTFTTQSLGSKKVSKVLDLQSGKELPWKMNDDHTMTIEQVDYSKKPFVTILEITLTDDVYGG